MKQKTIRIVTWIVAAFVVISGFALQGHLHAADYKQQLENSYTHAYYELTSAVSELDTALQKSRYAATPVMLSSLCTDICSKAAAAQMAMGELPFTGVLLEQTAAFLARTGDYAHALAHATAVDGSYNADAHVILQDLGKISSHLSMSLLDLQTDLSGGGVTISDLILAEKALDHQLNDGSAAPGGTAFQTIESDFPEMPTLIYDGPFSEHLSNRAALALEGLPQTSRDEARAVAAEFLGLRPQALAPAGEGHGVLPTWGFSATVDGGEIYIEMTQQGCKVISLFSSTYSGSPTISAQDAVQIAHVFLQRHGFDSMEPSYHINQGNVLTINFAPKVQNVICYPDLIKVSVALDTGRVTGFESHGWIMNHTNRTFQTPIVSETDAASVISPDLDVLSHQLALIPTGGEYEVLCHEFKCRTKQDSHIIVYVNATTGNEEKILLLLEDESGTLVW